MICYQTREKKKCFNRGGEKSQKAIVIQDNLILSRKREREKQANYCVYSFASLNVLREPGRWRGWVRTTKGRYEIGKREQALSPFAAFHSNPSALSSRGFFALYPQISHRRVTVRFRLALFHEKLSSSPYSFYMCICACVRKLNRAETRSRVDSRLITRWRRKDGVKGVAR